MQKTDTTQLTKGPPRCPKCGAELADAVLGGQCPACLVKVLRESDANATVPSPPPAAPLESPTHKPQAAIELRYFGDYELLGELGRGGMGVVYQARQLSLHRTLALKVIAPEQVASPKAAERFRTEAETAANLDHPHIVPLYDSGECDGQHYFTMKLIEGQSLAQALADGQTKERETWKHLQELPSPPTQAPTLPLAYPSEPRPTRFDPNQAASLLAKVADAVHYAHQHGILHRDLKPGNILIDSAGEPYVTDFGLAKLVQSDSSLTLSGEVLGTPAYMAPEQAAGKAKQMTTAADIYSLGAILYELLTGRTPFRGETPVETLHALLHTEPEAPRSLNRVVPRDLETICLKCLEKEPARRYTSAQALAEDLRRFIGGETVQARPIGPVGKGWRWCRRKPALAATLLLLQIVLALGLAGILWEWRKARREEFVTRENLYAADINLAHQALAADNFRQALDLLRKHIPNPGEPDLRGFEWRYLWQQCQSDELFSLPGHEQTATSVAFSPDGRVLVTGSYDETVKVWDLSSHRLLATLSDHTNQVELVAFSPRGDLLAIGSLTGLRLWDARTFQPLRMLPGAIVKAKFSPDGHYLVTGSTNGLILWNTHTWSVVKTSESAHVNRWRPFFGYTFGLAFSPDGSRIAAVVPDGVSLLSVPDLREVGMLKDPNMPRMAFVAFSPDGRTLATCTMSNNAVKLWDVEAKQELRMLSGHSLVVFSAAFTPDGRRLATCSVDQTIKLWDVASGTLVRSFRGHAEEVWEVAFAPDGKLLASVSKDGGVKLWGPLADPKRATELSSFAPLGFGSEGNLIGFTMKGGLGLTAFDPETLQPVGSQSFNGRSVRRPYRFMFSLGFLSTDGRTFGLDVVRNDGTRFAEADVWDLQRRQFLCSVASEIDPNPCMLGVTPFVFAPKGQLLATATSNQTVTVWQLPQGLRRCVLTNTWCPCAFSPDERILVTIGKDNETVEGEIKLWTIADDHPRLAARLSSRFTLPVALSPDGNMLACCSWGGFVHLLAMPSGQELSTLVGHQQEVSAISFSPDGQTLATTCNDKTLRLWHMATRRELMIEHVAGAGRLEFSPDGQTLAVEDWGTQGLR